MSVTLDVQCNQCTGKYGNVLYVQVTSHASQQATANNGGGQAVSDLLGLLSVQVYTDRLGDHVPPSPEKERSSMSNT